MSDVMKRISVGVAVVILSTLVVWLAAHALRAEAFMAVTPVQINGQQEQLDRMEDKLDWLVQYQIQRHEE